MEAMEYPLILHIYELTPPPSNEQNNSASSTVSFFSRILKPLGFGTYHTSLEINGYCYTFSAIVGIQKSSAANKASHVPPNGTYKESITVGRLSDSMDQNKINQCINHLRNVYFTKTSYHLACRNCNHFTETLATALVMADSQMLKKDDDGDYVSLGSLSSYPAWVNRLAKSGAGLMKEEDGCDVMKEARAAAGVEEKVGWNLKPSFAATGTSTDNPKARVDRTKKKTLTEAQKKALAKLRKK